MTKRSIFLLICLLQCPSLFAWDILSGISGDSFWGNLLSLIPFGTEPGTTPTIDPSRFEPGGGQGMVVANTNLFTGQPVYPISLGAINAHGMLSFPISITYGGPTKPIMESDNQRAPVGWIGLGWDLSIPYIAVNHKGTLTTTDDVVMCNLGPFGGGQILQNATSHTFYLSTNPYIQIKTDGGSGEFAGQIIRWTFTFPDGKRMVFGDNSNSQRTVFYTGNIIKASPYKVASPTHFIYRWDVSYLADANSANKILFDYQQEQESAGPNGNYIRESHVLDIKWLTPGNSEVERYQFNTVDKGGNEYVGYQSDGTEPRDNQKLFEKKRLDVLRCFKEGVETHSFKFIPASTPAADWEGNKNKSLLQEIQVFVNRFGTEVKDHGWTFAYVDNGIFTTLQSVTTPELRTDSYRYNGPYLASTNADQDRGTYAMLQNDNTTPVTLPTDNTKKLLWKPQSICDERFCYLLVKDKDGIEPDALGRTQKLYVEIHPNMGNYFDNNTTTGTQRLVYGDASTPADSLDLIPGGDFFLLVNYTTGNITFYAWDGLTWQLTKPFAGDPRYNPTTDSFGQHIKVFMGGNYFLVQKTSKLTSGGTGTATEIIPVIRRPDGSWSSLNQVSSACQLDNKSDYGEPIRASRTSGSCMEFNSDQLIVTASPSYFTVTHQGVDVMLLYALNQAGTGFTEMSKKLPVVAGAQLSGYPMNWQVNVISVVAAADYFVVGTSYSTSALQVMYFNGDSIYNVNQFGGLTTGVPQVWLSNEYFLEKGPDFRFWQKKTLSNGSVTFVRSTTALPFNYPSNVAKAFPLVRTHPSAFSIEYYDKPDSIGTRPLLNTNGGVYAVGLFQVNRNLSNGWADRTSQLVQGGNNLFDISFSPSDNRIFALSGQNSSGHVCGTGQSCTFGYNFVRTHPFNTTTFISPANDIDYFRVYPPALLTQTQAALSNAGRIAVFAFLNPTSRHVEFNYLQWNSNAYDVPQSYAYVSEFSSSSGLSSDPKDNVKSSIDCTNDPTWSVDLNSNTQNLEFESCEVSQSSPSGLSLGATRYVFNVDIRSHPLYGKYAALKGQLLATASYSNGLDTTYRVNAVNEPAHNSAWPTCLYVTRPYKQTTKAVSANQSHMTATTTFHTYNDNNGAPTFTVQALGSGPHRVSQTFFDSKFLPTQSITYAAASYPDTGSLKTASVTSALNSQSPYTSLKPIGSSKSFSDNAFRFQHSEAWRDIDASLNMAGMKTGNTPTFNLSEGWMTTQEVTHWNRFNQPTESRSPRSNQTADSAYSSFFYEGKRSDPIAFVSNAKLENCAVLTAENNNAGFSTLDEPGKWESSSAVSYSSSFSHTGRYSFKVVDSYGPTLNRVLKDVTRYQFGYRVSGWMYASGGTTPVLSVERRRADNSIASVISGQPPQGWIPNQWIRWEANLSYADLTANGLFTTSAADYLRIYFGTGAPKGNTANVVYVDDIVCTPSNASFSLSSYDNRGLKTSATSPNHITTYFDLNARGETTAVRDENFRIHGQTGLHRMGEN